MTEHKSCSTCRAVRPLEDFNRRTSAPDGRQPRCRDCSRAWYVENRDAHRENVRRRSAAVRALHSQRIMDVLRESTCVDCGESDVRCLEFDHVRGTKRADVTALLSRRLTWAVIEAEMDKCEVRCANCHRRVTAERSMNRRQRAHLDEQVDTRARALARLARVLPG